VRRSLLSFLLGLMFALLAPPLASAGGFATAGLSSTPDGVRPGQPWKVEITVLQHGRTPLDGLVPRVRIRSGDVMREFAARPAGRPGVYRAAVVFPTAGRWDYEVLDGFIDQMPHTFPAVRIGGGAATPAAPSPASSSSSPSSPSSSGGDRWLWGAGAAAALLLALALVAADRRRLRPRGPEPA
jgi:hypothetical protein